MAENMVAWAMLMLLWFIFIVGIVLGIAMLVQFLATVTGLARLFGRASQPPRVR